MEKRGEEVHDPSGRIDTIPTNIWAVSINKEEDEAEKSKVYIYLYIYII